MIKSWDTLSLHGLPDSESSMALTWDYNVGSGTVCFEYDDIIKQNKKEPSFI